jgi:hypothetical protein
MLLVVNPYMDDLSVLDMKISAQSITPTLSKAEERTVLISFMTPDDDPSL